MKEQDTNYTLPPSAVQNIIAGNIGLGESYILYETAENEFTTLIKKPFSGEYREIRIYKDNQYNSVWNIERKEVENGNYKVNNEYYTYSNIGYGQPLNLPIYEQITSYSTIMLCSIILITFVFRKVFRI